MGLTALLDRPFYVGSTAGGSGTPATGVSSDVPALYPVAVAGHSYMLDLESGEMRHRSIPLLRSQSDQGIQPGSASINPEDLWRRGTETWHLGAGQTYADRPESIAGRYRSSKGIFPWTKWQLSLLPATASKRTSTNTNLALAVAGARLYVADGSTLLYTTDITVASPTWTAVTGYTGGSILSVCSDGYTIYFTDGTNIWTTNTGTGAASSYNTLDAGLLRYTKGRVMAAGTGATVNSIYNVTSGTPPSALLTHANSNFTWVDYAEGPSHIYAAGYSGDKSLIYKIQVKPDGTALDTPIVAGELPDGEIIRSLQGYLGFLLIGTDLGFRLAEIDLGGMLNLGALISMSNAVRCWEPQGQYVWFGWTNYDTTSTGLGRADLGNFTEPDLVLPAYVSDLMATAQGNVLSAVTFQSLRVFAVSASGIHAETTNKVASGTLDSGLYSYGIHENKTAISLDVRTTALPAGSSWTPSLAKDDGTFTAYTGDSASGSVGKSVDLQQVSGERLEWRLSLARATDTTTGPTIQRVTLKTDPTAALSEIITWPLLLHEEIKLLSGQPAYVDVAAELAYIKKLRELGSIITAQEGAKSYTVRVRDYEWIPYKETWNRNANNGTCLVHLKTITF